MMSLVMNVLSQLLTEMDDSGSSGVIIIGITNRPDLIDTSLFDQGGWI